MGSVLLFAAKKRRPDIEASVWFALVGPAGLPRPIVDKANQEVDRYLASDEGRAKLD